MGICLGSLLKVEDFIRMSMTDNCLAFVFPGQGSQSVGMMQELAASHPEVEQTFRTASDVLGYDLWHLVAEGPDERLNLTEQTQPAMLAAGVAAYRVWEKVSDVRPGWMAGHSLGEYTALVCAGAIAFEDAVALVVERARLMQGAVATGTGAMAAILGLDDAQVHAVCAALSSAEEVVTPANFNAPGQVVIAGHAASVARAVDALKAEGAKRAVLLPVSVPSHCPLMEGAAEKFPYVVDIIYNPKETRLLRAARAGGAIVANGMYMLTAQAAAAEEIWLSQTIEPAVIESIAREMEAAL